MLSLCSDNTVYLWEINQKGEKSVLEQKREYTFSVDERYLSKIIHTPSVWKKGTCPKLSKIRRGPLLQGEACKTEEMLLLKRDSLICFHCVPCQCMKDTEKVYVTYA